MANWKVIRDYDNYEVSDEGEVRNRKTGRVLKTGYASSGYRKVNLSTGNVVKNALVHRLVADNFLPNPGNKNVVNHIDGDKSNNRLANLEWCTAGENIKHAFDNSLNYRPDTSGVPRRRTRIVEIDAGFDSISDCARFLNTPTSNVSACLSGRSKTCCGYHIVYDDMEAQ